jgi:hypothetical protein
MSEFYEKYWRIRLPDGSVASPILTEMERKIIDKAEELKVAPYVRVFGRKRGWHYIIHPSIQEELQKK